MYSSESKLLIPEAFKQLYLFSLYRSNYSDNVFILTKRTFRIQVFISHLNFSLRCCFVLGGGLLKFILRANGRGTEKGGENPKQSLRSLQCVTF